MGIQVEFNPDLALRNISEFREGRRKREECIPEGLEAGKVFGFLKEGQRNYWLEGEVPLLETGGDGKLSRPLASIVILESSHRLINGRPYTEGRYKVVEVFDPEDKRIRFDGFARAD
jgi:hypothetical protein